MQSDDDEALARGRRRPHVVIVGGGFAGLYAARGLRRAAARVTLVDRTNHHLFQPLLYQVATGALSTVDVAYPLRAALRRQKNTRVLLGEVTAVDLARREVELDNGSLAYDYLILAAGSQYSYFGHPEWSEVAPGLKTARDALDIRRRIYLAYEAAERESDERRKIEWTTFVVVGAGPTGVELAGALAEIGRETLAADFRNVDPTRSRVVLLEAQDRVLPLYPPKLSDAAARDLADLGVEVRVGAAVEGVDARGVVAGGERIDAKTVLWAAGVQASPLARTLGVELDRAGRVIVDDAFLTVPAYPEVFVVGDLAHARAQGQPIPAVASAAIQQGRYCARAIQREIDGRERPTFRYRDKGALAAIGRSRGVAEVGRFEFSGFVAWFLWLVVHIYFLVGFASRLRVLIGWTWAYFASKRFARVISDGFGVLPEVTEQRGRRETDAAPPRRSLPARQASPPPVPPS